MNAEPDPDLGPLITLDNLCEGTQSLPTTGGVLDQDSVIMRQLLCVRAAKAAKHEREMAAAKAKRK
jgi:hypothetical protein